MPEWWTRLCGLCHVQPPFGMELYLEARALPGIKLCKPCLTKVQEWERLEEQGLGRIVVRWCRGCGMPKRVYFKLHKKNGRPKKCL